MDRLPDWARTALEWLWRVKARVERIPWYPWVSRAVLAAVGVLVLWAFSRCDPRSSGPLPDDVPVEEMVPKPVFDATTAQMQDTILGLRDRLYGWQRRGPRVIVRTDTVQAPPPVCSPVTVIKDNKLSTPVYSQTTRGWEVKLLRDVDVTGCDGLRIVGATVVCDTPRLGKWSLVVGGGPYTSGLTRSTFTNSELAGLDAYAGIGWQRHRDSRLSVAALYGVDQTIRLRAEWKVNLW